VSGWAYRHSQAMVCGALVAGGVALAVYQAVVPGGAGLPHAAGAGPVPVVSTSSAPAVVLPPVPASSPARADEPARAVASSAAVAVVPAVAGTPSTAPAASSGPQPTPSTASTAPAPPQPGPSPSRPGMVAVAVTLGPLPRLQIGAAVVVSLPAAAGPPDPLGPLLP
jgi:hypothetical protein